MKEYNNKTVLITGHTGFKGSWLCAWLNYLGANVVGISHDTVSTPSNYSTSKIKECNSEIIHLSNSGFKEFLISFSLKLKLSMLE